MIERIRTYRLQHKLEESFGFSQWHYDTRNALLVELVDSSGASGWGECYGPAEVTQSAISSFYAPLLKGWDPLKNEAAWQHCWRASLDFARKGVMMGAVSGLDMAMLDLKGKLLGVSVSELMGGRQRDRVFCYATGMYFRKVSEEALLEMILEEASGYVDRGFGALKIKVGKNLKFDELQVRSMRNRFSDTQLMADSNHAYDLPEAVRMGRVLDECGYAWFEEPLSPQHASLFRQLSEKVDVPIATGECEQTRWGFQDLLSLGGVNIAQPDLAYCGGPTEALKIRAIASSHGVNTVPHAWGTMLNLASATHFLASAYVEPGRAEPAEPLLEVDNTPNPMRDEMYEVALEISNGVAVVPDAPGLGVKPDLKAMEAFCVYKTEL
ncbi:mandelate racemase/muconate lactonizing enzyme family protein [Pelagicoccus sp. SDUM812005]|uniref:mandelate racemase/muconate lactonizing enzyme family protein n=1 Tax=Pelagicoccus sp. SDUM812005 TaxID=3041257 RepID=UPI00280D3732|nr:mandelate racemase/muconate lactonizing enzyme family protein [Pelagicoccus sp. SDUM812005]MDQ8180295.1 mandelate racemase/muconate lactonizing enzyme family protein [Pelagicoccus sp. SDUM812005]